MDVNDFLLLAEKVFFLYNERSKNKKIERNMIKNVFLKVLNVLKNKKEGKNDQV